MRAATRRGSNRRRRCSRDVPGLYTYAREACISRSPADFSPVVFELRQSGCLGGARGISGERWKTIGDSGECSDVWTIRNFPMEFVNQSLSDLECIFTPAVLRV